MFRHKTLFVVGAGASAEVGLPVGLRLAKMIAELLNVKSGGRTDTPGDKLLAQLYEKHPLPNNGYHQAAWVIRDGVRLTNSIDDFLDMHSRDELVQQVGKAAIVKTILGAEAESRLIHNPERKLVIDEIENTWYMKFFRMIGRGVNATDASEIFSTVRFIVFNYDRCLEYFLLNALQLVYSLQHHEAAGIVDALDIFHPYGVVAELPLLGSGIPFGGGDNLNVDLVGLSKSVKTYTEQMTAGDTLTRLHADMFWAEQFVFLGFGYHDQNLSMLTPAKKLTLKPVIGTASGMSDTSIEAVRQQFANIFTGGLQGVVPAMKIENRTCANLFDHYEKRLPS